MKVEINPVRRVRVLRFPEYSVRYLDHSMMVVQDRALP